MAPKVKRKSISDQTPRSAARSKKARNGRKAAAPSRFGSFFLPLFLSICLLICLSVLGYLGLQNVTASKFFNVKAVEVYGTVRASREDIGRAAANAVEKTGVWNADLTELKAKIEKLPFVKSASVSRVLPDGLRVNIVERVPVTIVKLSGGDMLVDEEGNLLAPANAKEESLPITMSGWDETKTERAYRDNHERIKLFQKMTVEWREGGLAARVKNVDLGDLRDPKAISEDSGLPVTISVGRDSFAKNLKNGISAVAGKGEMFDGVSLVGSNMILSSRKTQTAAAGTPR
jgi:cell division septal protein FtsQ